MTALCSSVGRNLPDASVSSDALDAYIAAIMQMAATGFSYQHPEEALFLPDDPEVIREVRACAEHLANDRLKYVIVVGIGGSCLGAKAVYDALRGPYDLTLTHAPRLLFLDTISSVSFEQTMAILDAEVKHSEELLVNVISKSGTTTETIANFTLLYERLAVRFPDVASRVVVTTDQGSVLHKKADERGYAFLSVPVSVGGRYSVFSAVGLFPLILAGIDVDGLRQGGSTMRARVLHAAHGENCARMFAEELFSAAGSGYSLFNLFYFHPELESLGKWERQLFAESLGKENDVSGKVVHAGITPLVSIASNDLHSMAQLYFGGPRDKCTALVRAEIGHSQTISADGPLAGLVPGIGGKTSEAVRDAIYAGVAHAYRTHELPHWEVSLSDISTRSLGAYLEWRMATVMYLGKLMRVDPFDQPNVEDYKRETKKVLGGGI